MPARRWRGSKLWSGLPSQHTEPRPGAYLSDQKPGTIDSELELRRLRADRRQLRGRPAGPRLPPSRPQDRHDPEHGDDRADHRPDADEQEEQIVKEGERFVPVTPEQSMGSVHRHWGNFGHKIRAYTYLARLGREGVKRMSAMAVLSSRYVAKQLEETFPFLPPQAGDVPRMHEFIITLPEELFAKIEAVGIPRANIIPRVGKLFLGHVAAIGRAALQQPVGDFGMPRPELRLVIFVPVPIEPEPAHPVEDRGDRRQRALTALVDHDQEEVQRRVRDPPAEHRAGGPGG